MNKWLETSLITGFTLVIACVIFIIDLNAPLTIAIGAMYSIVVLYSWILPGKLTSLVVALCCTALICIDLYLSYDAMDNLNMAPLNSLISMMIIWICAVIMTIAKRSHESFESSQNLLEKQISKVKHMNAMLISKNRELEQFAYIASHDLQEPLRTVINFAQLLKEQCKDEKNQKAKKYLEFIGQGAQRMSSFIKGLLDYSRIGRNKELTDVDCNVLIKAVQDDLSVNITETGTIINVDELPKLKGFENELRMLFQNLITNAIKFREKGTVPIINISAQKDNGYWEFRFQDNGIGIAPEHKERIFVIFQRLYNRSEYEGTGIGLAHCLKVAELHGGKIWVDSQLNEGSTFYVSLKN